MLSDTNGPSHYAITVIPQVNYSETAQDETILMEVTTLFRSI